MMLILKDISLKSFNSFGVEATTKYFIDLQKREELSQLFHNEQLKTIPRLILGGGSNILFRKRYFEGITLKVAFKGIKVTYEDLTRVKLEVAAGENWHELVNYTLEKNWSGLENLSFIPGTVGAAPVQNIGAYNVEVKDVIEKLEAYDIVNNKTIIFSSENCRFRYRDSFFKREGKNRFIIISVHFHLLKKYKINISYKALREELLKMNLKNPSLKEISQTIINLRIKKLPDPKIYGNAGSFFKNPIVKNSFYKRLKKKYPDIIGHIISKDHVKLYAGWLIERSGWKGKQMGHAKVYQLQALVLINNDGQASGEDIYILSECIIKDVRDLFGISLSREVYII